MCQATLFKRQYLLGCKVIRYCFSALHGGTTKTATPTYYCIAFALICTVSCSAAPDKLFSALGFNLKRYIVASKLNDPICHSNECQIGSFSSEATIFFQHVQSDTKDLLIPSLHYYYYSTQLFIVLDCMNVCN